MQDDKTSVAALAELVDDEVYERGHVRLESITGACFEAVAATLGPIVARLDVRAGAARSLLSSAATMPLHTDDPEAEIVGWWCARAATTGGETVLLDAAGIVDALDERDLSELTTTPILRPVARERLEPYPCLVERNGRYRLYYSPWHVLESYSHAQRRALDSLQAWLRRETPMVIALREGEALFIDNGRLLHGRMGFPAESGRLLKRVWIGLRPRPHGS